MNIILLSGGSGKRLWPLSNEVRSKQFLKIFETEDGSRESMIQRNYRMIRDIDPNAAVTIATSNNQVAAIRAQLGDEVDISIEPCRRDTFPAIALATAYLHDVMNLPAGEAVVVSPVDSYVEPGFFRTLERLYDQALKGEANIVLMGIEPTYPSEKYGYIVPETEDVISRVNEFKEKPDSSAAEQYIRQGALWNAGVFAYKIGYVLDIARSLFGTEDYEKLFSNYEDLQKISFDYAVVEKEPRIQVIRYSGEWSDLGTWDTITGVMSDETAGNASAADCENTHVINELQIPLVAIGLKDIAIAATPDGILVTDKKSSDKLKDYISDQRPMYEKRVWGEYMVLDYRIQDDGQNFLTKHLIITPGQHISYQRHAHRTEMWTFVDGSGTLILDDELRKVERGDTAYIRPGMKHAIEADTELHIIEVQIGDELTEEDIERLDWNWEK